MGTAAVLSNPDLLSREALLDRLKAVGVARYHHQHPFHLRMHEGQLTRGQLQAWVLNRYYYQSRIPMKDSLLLAKAKTRRSGEPGESGFSTTTVNRMVTAE